MERLLPKISSCLCRQGASLALPRPTCVRARPYTVREQRGPRAGPGARPMAPFQSLVCTSTSLSLQHLEIRKAFSETSWKLLLQSQGRYKCRGHTLGQARGEPEARGGLAVSPQGCGESSELCCATGKQVPLPSLLLPGEELQHRQESIFLPFPSALKQSDKA